MKFVKLRISLIQKLNEILNFYRKNFKKNLKFLKILTLYIFF